MLSKTTGSVFPSLSAPDIKEFQIIAPSLGVMDAFEEFTSQMLLRQHINQIKIKKLAELRDTLLPRLISGQLRLPEAQALVEDAVDA